MLLKDFKPIAYQHYNHYFELFAHPNRGQFEESSDWVRWVYNLPAPIYNGCMLKESCLENWKACIDQNLAFLREKNIPFACILTETEKLDEMSAYLLKQGCECPGPFRFVLAELSASSPRLPPKEPVSVKRVSSDEELKTWVDILCTVFFPTDKEELSAFYYRHYSRLGYDSTCPIWHYLGYLNDEPVGASSLLLTYGADNTPLMSGLWNGGVLEHGRKKGVGGAMASQRLEDAFQGGFSSSMCILMSEAMAWSYCQPLGFKDAFKFHPYFS